MGHGLVKGALFLAAGILLHRFGGRRERAARPGEAAPAGPACCSRPAGLGLAGLPPFGTHPGKALVEAAARASGRAWLVPVVMAASALTAGAVLRAAARIFLGWGPVDDPEQAAQRSKDDKETAGGGWHTPWVMLAPMAVLVALSVAAGLSHGLRDRAWAAAAGFIDRASYVARVLDGTPIPVADSHAPESGSWLAALLPTAGAVALALASLHYHRIPASLRAPLTKAFRPPIVRLKGAPQRARWRLRGLACDGGGRVRARHGDGRSWNRRVALTSVLARQGSGAHSDSH